MLPVLTENGISIHAKKKEKNRLLSKQNANLCDHRCTMRISYPTKWTEGDFTIAVVPSFDCKCGNESDRVQAELYAIFITKQGQQNIKAYTLNILVIV